MGPCERSKHYIDPWYTLCRSYAREPRSLGDKPLRRCRRSIGSTNQPGDRHRATLHCSAATGGDRHGGVLAARNRVVGGDMRHHMIFRSRVDVTLTHSVTLAHPQYAGSGEHIDCIRLTQKVDIEIARYRHW